MCARAGGLHVSDLQLAPGNSVHPFFASPSAASRRGARCVLRGTRLLGGHKDRPHLRQTTSLFEGVFLFLRDLFLSLGPIAFLTPLQVSRSFGEEVWRLSAIEVGYSLGMMAGGLLTVAVAVIVPMFNTPATVMLQERVEQAYLGRVFSVNTMISGSMMPCLCFSSACWPTSSPSNGCSSSPARLWWCKACLSGQRGAA